MISLSPLALLSVSLCGIVIGYCIHAFLFAKLGYYWTDDLRCSCGKPVGSPDFNPYGMIIHERVNYLDVVCESCVDIAVARENQTKGLLLFPTHRVPCILWRICDRRSASNNPTSRHCTGKSRSGVRQRL